MIEKVSDDDLRLITWTIMDGCLVKRMNKTEGKEYIHHLQFKLSKQRKIKSLKKLLDRMEVPYTFRKATMSGLNKLQPYMIRIYGDYSRKISDYYLNGVKQFPSLILELNKKQAKVVLSIIAITDGSKQNLRYIWSTVSSIDYDIIRCLCSIHNIKYRDYGKKIKRSGFPNGKPQYEMGFYL